MVFNSKCKHHKTKIPLKKSIYTSIYLSTYLSINAPESLEKNIDIQKEGFYQYTHTMKLIFPSKLLLEKLFCCFFPSAPPVLITNALLVLPVGQTPHLVCDHQLLNVSEELYSTDLCQ